MSRKRTGGVVVAGPAFKAERLVPDDVDGLDVLRVPRGLEDPVGETQAQDVLHGLLAEEVVDAEDGVFGHDFMNESVELAGRAEVVAEGLLDHDPAARSERRGAEGLHGSGEDVRWQGEVCDGGSIPIPEGGAQRRRVGHVTTVVVQP